MTQVTAGKLLAEGKTKKIWEAQGMPGFVIIESKDDITAGDGAKHDVIEGKGMLSTRTTANVFKLLASCGVPLAFQEQLDDTRFLARQCDMIPFEVVVRRETHGSYLKRHPQLQKGHLFHRLVLEFFLKTSGKRWEGIFFPKDDPFVKFDEGKMLFFLPDQPIQTQSPFLTLNEFPPITGSPEIREEMGKIALKTFLVLEKAWQLVGPRLVDFKVEFGKDQNGVLLLADVIDNDSWRVLQDGSYIDKQIYRDGADLNTVTAKFRFVEELTKRFGIPRQQIILWRASKNDDLTPFEEALMSYGAQTACEVRIVTCSTHKEPVRACEELTQAIQEIPDSVVIAYVGRSNGAGPTLSAQTTVPVISVPATWKEFPEDIWSSLRTPSDTPALTILDPKNAVLAALQILAMRNPRIYADLRARQEERLCNLVKI